MTLYRLNQKAIKSTDDMAMACLALLLVMRIEISDERYDELSDKLKKYFMVSK